MGSPESIFNETHPGLDFAQAFARVQFAVILMSRRLEDPDDNLQNALFSYDRRAFTFTPIGDEYLTNSESINALGGDLVELAKRNDSCFTFLLVSYVTGDETRVVLHGVSPSQTMVRVALLHRRKFGNPLLRNWTTVDSVALTDGIVARLEEYLKTTVFEP